MAALFLDENMALAVETALRARGHFVTSTYAEGRTGLPTLSCSWRLRSELGRS